MKQGKIILTVFLAGIAVALVIGLWLYNKPQKNMERTRADYQISSSELLSQFESNTAEATEMYQNKVLEVSGVVQSITKIESNINVLLDAGGFFGVNCSLPLSDETELEDGKLVTIKGECKGYLDDVILTNCILIK